MVSLSDASLEHIHATELFPLGRAESEDPDVDVPFPLLCGEFVKYLGYTADGTIVISNFRVGLMFNGSLIVLPLGVIEYIETREIFFLYIFCKDGHSVRCTFSTNEACLKWYKFLLSQLLPPVKLTDTFAFAFNAWCRQTDQETTAIGHQLARGGERKYTFGREVDRMRFNLKREWRICYVNEKFRVCSSYPELHIVPSAITDENIEGVASFRSSGRFPSVVWRNQRNGVIIARCSQPEIGWLGWRKLEDEKLVWEIAKACTLNGQKGNAVCKTLIVDARSYAAAVANRAKGGGVECAEYYDNCEVRFMNLANIHSIRKSFHGLRNLLLIGQDQSSWLSALEGTKWLQHISGLLRSAVLITHANNVAGQPVIIHCSDGWDRTSQLSALAQLMLDPFYRTFEGFQVLVEKEWLEFGHKFADRCGHGKGSVDPNERCPVFLQWLDCVYQLLTQYPCAFEFNMAYLVKLASHTYSCLFGTFLCNNVKEREEHSIDKTTCSVWALLNRDNDKFRNYTYKQDNEVLLPHCDLIHLKFWSSFYLGLQTEAATVENGVEVTVEKHAGNSLPVSKSFNAIASLNAHQKATSASVPDLLDPNCMMNGACDKAEGCHGDDSEQEAAAGKVTKNDNCASPLMEEQINNCDELNSAFKDTNIHENGIGHVDRTLGEDNDSCGGDEKALSECTFKNSTDTLVSESCLSCAELPAELSRSSSENIRSLAASATVGACENVNGVEVTVNGGVNAHIPICNGHCQCSKSSQIDGYYYDDDYSPLVDSSSTGTSGALCLDEDGLSAYVDPVQQSLKHLVSNYRAKIEGLLRQLEQARRYNQQAGFTCSPRRPCDFDENSLPESVGSDGHNSVNSMSASDSSWENVDGNNGMTSWQPDHAATHCGCCHREFWAIRRKHHCRNCGYIFCSDCTNYFMAIPEQQLFDHQRVCKQCHLSLNSANDSDDKSVTGEAITSSG